MRCVVAVLLLLVLLVPASAVSLYDVYEVPAGSGDYIIVYSIGPWEEPSSQGPIYATHSIYPKGGLYPVELQWSKAIMSDETRTSMYYTDPSVFEPGAPENYRYIITMDPHRVFIVDPDSEHDGWTLWEVKHGRSGVTITPTPTPVRTPAVPTTTLPIPVAPSPPLPIEGALSPISTVTIDPAPTAAILPASPTLEPAPTGTLPRFDGRRYFIGPAPNLPGLITVGTQAPAVTSAPGGRGFGAARWGTSSSFGRWSPARYRTAFR